MPRLFFALLPRAGDLPGLQALASTVARHDARPVAAPDLHLTLCFLGEAPAEPALALLQALRLPPIAGVRFDTLDYWARAGVLCVIPHGAGMEAIRAVAADIRAGLAAAGCAFDDKPFRPHVTLARQRAAPDATQQWPRPLPEPLTLEFESLALLESRTGVAAGEPRYAPLASRRLASPAD